MNGSEVLRIVDAIHRDKNIDKELVFEGIEQAILSAARKHFGEESEINVDIDRETGEPSVIVDGEALEPDEIGDLMGRIAAQTAKQVMIQKIREAERDALFEEYDEMRGQIVMGTVSRVDGGSVTVNLGKVEGILPRSEQIPGESHRAGERVRAIVMDVRKHGSRVRIILSRTHPEMVRRLFEIEIPEVAEHVIEVRSLAREAGYRSKVAVSCIDSKIDCVGACVGVRGARIKNVVDELAGERIDIVRWNDSLQVLVPNALQPAEVEDVILCPMLGKVIVLVQDDQLSLAIGKKGQNVRLASKLVGWDIFVMNQEKLDEQLNKSVTAFSQVPGVSDELAENLVAQGFFTFDDLSVIEPEQLAELGGLTAEQCEAIVNFADHEAERIEREERRAYEERRALAAAGIKVEREPKSEPDDDQQRSDQEGDLELPDESAASAIEQDSIEQDTEVAAAESTADDAVSGADDESRQSDVKETLDVEQSALAGEAGTAVADEPAGGEAEAQSEENGPAEPENTAGANDRRAADAALTSSAAADRLDGDGQAVTDAADALDESSQDVDESPQDVDDKGTTLSTAEASAKDEEPSSSL